MSEELQTAEKDHLSLNSRCAFLSQHQIKMIDAALTSLGKFGEVRLVVEKGVLRYIVTQNSIDALKCSLDDFSDWDNGKHSSER